MLAGIKGVWPIPKLAGQEEGAWPGPMGKRENSLSHMGCVEGKGHDMA